MCHARAPGYHFVLVNNMCHTVEILRGSKYGVGRLFGELSYRVGDSLSSLVKL